VFLHFRTEEGRREQLQRSRPITAKVSPPTPIKLEILKLVARISFRPQDLDYLNSFLSRSDELGYKPNNGGALLLVDRAAIATPYRGEYPVATVSGRQRLSAFSAPLPQKSRIEIFMYT